MNRKDLKQKVDELISSGIPKSQVFLRLSGTGVEDHTLAYVIAARIDPRRCEANRWRIRIMVMIAYVEVVFSFLAGLDVGMEISKLGGAIGAVASVLLALLLARGFQRTNVAAYNAYLILAIMEAPRQLNNLSHAPTATGIGLAIGAALYAYVWSLRQRLFPDFAFIGPRKVDGVYAFYD